MYIRAKKPKNKILLTITMLIIALIIIALCVQTILKNNLTNKSIIAGRDIAKNKATVELDKIDWKKYMDNSVGKITIEDNGKTVEMTGNTSIAGKNAIYYIPDSQQIQTFSFEFDLDFGHSFLAAGIMLKVSEIDDTLQGYMLCFANPVYGIMNSLWCAMLST